MKVKALYTHKQRNKELRQALKKLIDEAERTILAIDDDPEGEFLFLPHLLSAIYQFQLRYFIHSK